MDQKEKENNTNDVGILHFRRLLVYFLSVFEAARLVGKNKGFFWILLECLKINSK